METTGPEAIGVIAGAGQFPFMVVAGAKRAGCRVVVVGLRGLADPALADLADSFRWSGLAKLGQWIRIFKRERITRAIMAGYVHKQVMYGRFRLLKLLPDWTSFKLWFFGLRDKRNDTVLGAVADVMEARGVTLENAVQYCAEDLAPEGVLSGPASGGTGAGPGPELDKDIEFGWRIAKELGRLDIGQAVAVKETDVLAVEAIEGTNRMIERAGQLCPKGGWTLIKVAKPDQDMRFDIPTVGPETIEHLAQHGGTSLVIEAGKTVIVDRQRMLDAARRHKIVVKAMVRSD
ncbi:MAG: UDP-2,3-diacylglucosamine diphosphatase LpxI [Planctomycetes bacterium]|nr:UDP-2,3-diacylglucosamine diphosphatase LpxI [Planctomycetota bacterium]